MKFRGGEFSTGTTGNFQPELTTAPLFVLAGIPPGRCCSLHSPAVCAVSIHEYSFRAIGDNQTTPLCTGCWRRGRSGMQPRLDNVFSRGSPGGTGREARVRLH